MEVRLVGEKGEQLGIMPLVQAREVAKNRNLDLVEVAATAVPPVCRLLDMESISMSRLRRSVRLEKARRLHFYERSGYDPRLATMILRLRLG